ncbi:MAG: fused MFS/spermidine synthase [Bacteroidetes bacterium]|nr:fused MFS/spermidine synthase [Bacteroidota bacterium]
MAIELCGAKLLMPFYGGSLYVWATVMGITLSALASGYFFGGYLSSKQNKNNLQYIISIAVCIIFLIPVLNSFALPYITYLHFKTGLICSSFVVLFPSLFLLGASSPLIIDLQNSLIKNAGRAGGYIYAISTLGGIFATFSCGFYFIPFLGINYTLMLFASFLLLGLLFSFKIKFPFVILFLSFVGVYFSYSFSKPKSEVLFESESLMGYLKVTKNKSHFNSINLSINNIIQTEMNTKSGKSLSEYIKNLDSLIQNQIAKKNALIIGLGGGLTANLFCAKNYNVDGVEFDDRIIYCAKKYFNLNPNVKTYCCDGRNYLNNCKKKYDLVLLDVFKAEEQPWHIITLESLTKIKSLLNIYGKLYINWHGYLTGENSNGTMSLLNTLINLGYNVKVYSNSNDQNFRNLILIASIQPQSKIEGEIDYILNNQVNVNSDNMPCIDIYNAKANKTWRTNYLRFYQNKK